MMKLSMLSLVSVVVAERTKCENPDLGQALCPDYNAPENSYTLDELAALQECDATAACESVCTCFVQDDGQKWMFVPTQRQKCDLTGFFMALCRAYNEDDTSESNPLDYYTKTQIDALTTCEDAQCCTPTCTCFVNEDGESQDWLNVPVTDECCTSLTDISTDASAVYYVDLDLDGAQNNHERTGEEAQGEKAKEFIDENEGFASGAFGGFRVGINNHGGTTHHDDLDGALKSHSHHGNHECTEVEEAEGDKVNEFIDFVDGGLISGRVGISNSDTTSNPEEKADDVCSDVQRKCWYGKKAVDVCKRYNAYLESEKEKGLAECYAPADYNVALADGDAGATVEIEDKPLVPPSKSTAGINAESVA